jgi:hypothetical protein
MNTLSALKSQLDNLVPSLAKNLKPVLNYVSDKWVKHEYGRFEHLSDYQLVLDKKGPRVVALYSSQTPHGYFEDRKYTYDVETLRMDCHKLLDDFEEYEKGGSDWEKTKKSLLLLDELDNLLKI